MCTASTLSAFYLEGFLCSRALNQISGHIPFTTSIPTPQSCTFPPLNLQSEVPGGVCMGDRANPCHPRKHRAVGTIKDRNSHNLFCSGAAPPQLRQGQAKPWWTCCGLSDSALSSNLHFLGFPVPKWLRILEILDPDTTLPGEFILFFSFPSHLLKKIK